VLGWLTRLFAPRSLEALGSEPIVVRVTGRIASSNDAQSPITELKAAAFIWKLVVRYNAYNPFTRSDDREVFKEIASAVSGPDLLVSTQWGSVLVEMDGLVVKSPGSAGGIVSLDRPPPIPELVPAFTNAGYAVSIQEITLRKGDLVRLIGHVQRARGDQKRGAYRTSHETKPEYFTRPDLGPVQLVDLSLTEI